MFYSGGEILRTVIVIGAGPAGMMAALTAAEHGAKVMIVEKMDRAGKKLRITGKGRCNITSSVEKDQIIKGFPRNGKFLYSCLNQFSNTDLIKFFNDRGLKTKIERGNRVFPESDKAQDVIDTLLGELFKKGVEIKTGTKVLDIIYKGDNVEGVKTNRGILTADAVVLATGGMSYPLTGSTGDGYKWAQDAGHIIIDPRPGLVPLVVEDEWVKGLQGLSLKNIRASAFKMDGKKINEEFGEMLFTHFGVSGPIILTMSRDIVEYMYRKKSNVTVSIDLKPALSEEKLDERLQRDFIKFSRKRFKNSLDDLLPRKLIPIIIELSEINPEKDVNKITRNERWDFIKLLKNLSFIIIASRPIEEAIVTAGGVNVKEINPKTMQSKKINALYFAGEIIDVDGYTGGYNLQAAFSSGWVAGENAADTGRNV